MEQIKFQLNHSDMSMKELADYFDFANPSFFGKFVKQHLGMSPMQYRALKEE
jgi:AraC-like DNA-binding protein